MAIRTSTNKMQVVGIAAIVMALHGCGSGISLLDFEKIAKRHIERPCDYSIESTVPSESLRIPPSDQLSGKRVVAIGTYFQDTESVWHDGACRSPYIEYWNQGGQPSHVSHGSKVVYGESDAAFFWMHIRCEQMISLTSCQNKRVELHGTYEVERDANGHPTFRIKDVTYVKELQ